MSCCVPTYVSLFVLKSHMLLTIVCLPGCMVVHSKVCGFNCAHVDCMFKG